MILARRRRGEPIAGGRRRIDDFLRHRRARAFEHAHGALHIDIHVVNRPLDRRHDVADPGEMKDVAAAVEDRISRPQAADVDAVQRQIRVPCVMREIGLAPARQIVDDVHAIAAIQQQVHHVAADEACASGHDRYGPSAHAAFSLCRRRTLK